MNTTPDQDHWRQVWSQVVAKTWSDEAFKRRLLADPADVLKDYGLAIPAGVQLTVLECTEAMRYLVLPPRPPEGLLSDDDLKAIAGGLAKPDDLAADALGRSHRMMEGATNAIIEIVRRDS